jgi:putative transposase
MKDVSIPLSTKPTIGVDVGIKVLATLSDGTIVPNPRYLIKSEQQLKKQQRTLSKKPKGTRNRIKQRFVVAKVYRRIARQRNNYAHKVSRQLVNNYGTIIFEDLNIQGMLRNHKLAKHISDASWSKLINYTKYKAEEAGVSVRLVDPRNTSQRCSTCGRLVPKTLAERVHNCPHCGLVMDRDLNASINICTEGTSGKYAYGDSTSTCCKRNKAS